MACTCKNNDDYCAECAATVINRIDVDATNTETLATFVGPLASRYSYKPELRARIDELALAAKRSTNRHFVLDGAILRAGQSTREGAKAFMQDGYVLVSIKGCGKPTHMTGTNGGTFPCGSTINVFGTKSREFCALCEPFLGSNPECGYCSPFGHEPTCPVNKVDVKLHSEVR